MNRTINPAQPMLLDVYPNFWLYTYLNTAFFCSLFLLFPYVMNTFFKDWYNNLEKDKRKDLPAYVVCLFHHVVIVPWSFSRIFADVIRSGNSEVYDYTTTELDVVPVLVGYLFADAVCSAIPQLQWEYIIHHAITLYLTFAGSFSGAQQLIRFIPHLLASDFTQVRTLMWVVQ